MSAPPKLVGMLSWYDESASWLTAAIASHARAGLTHLVAVDGAYMLYPGGRPRSGVEQHRAISETCEGLGISCTIHTPWTVWAGNEVEKRSFMFKLALMLTDSPQDWLLSIDADHLMTDPDDLPKALSETDLHVAEMTLWQRPDTTVPEARQFKMPRVHQTKLPLAFRANPGLHCHINHYTYVDGEGRVLWGPKNAQPALDLGHVKIEHRTAERDLARHEDQYAYYRRRDELNIERTQASLCDWDDCDQHPEITVPYKFERVEGSDAIQAGHINVCAKHAKRAHYENRHAVKLLGHEYGEQGELLKRHT